MVPVFIRRLLRQGNQTEFRTGFLDLAAALLVSIVIPRWGIHLNREIEVNYSHRNYQLEYGPRRNRLTHSLLFEEFEVVMEEWQTLEHEFKEKGKTMI